MAGIEVIRKVDASGRISLPIDFKKNLGIKEGDYLELRLQEREKGYEVLLKKHETIQSLEEQLEQIVEKIDSEFQGKMDSEQREELKDALHQAAFVLLEKRGVP